MMCPDLPAFYRLEMPVGPFADTFAQDRDYFREIKFRTAIRWAKANELEAEPEIVGNPGYLPLWALVTAVSTGLHVVVPIWRGYRPSPLASIDYIPAKTENEIAAIAQHCLNRGGYDPEEWAKSLEKRQGWPTL